MFLETKRSADFLAAYLSQEQYPATSIHGYVYCGSIRCEVVRILVVQLVKISF